MELVLISYEHFFEGEADMVCGLLDEYHFTFHLRKPGASEQEYSTFLEKIPEQMHKRIMLHDAFSLYGHFALKGLHFSGVTRVRREKYEQVYSSTSCHSVNELEMFDGRFDRLFISPLFESISKAGYKGDLDMEQVSRILNNPHKSHIVGLGGINEDNICMIKEMGFDGAAVCGAVWGKVPQRNSNKIRKNFNNIYQCLRLDHIA